MPNALASRALTAAELSLVVLCAAIACYLPPLNERVLDVPVLMVGLGLAAAASLLLHLIFVGLLARAYGRSPVRYVVLALLTLPLGSIVGLVLLEWHQASQGVSPQRPA